MATKQFILELSRINSVRVQSEGEDADNKSNYTCIIPEINLKKNDTVQLDSSVINVRGADSSSLQFEGSYANNNNLIMDNIFMFEVGFYLNHIGLNAVHLPFAYTGQVTGGQKMQKFETDKTTGNGDNEKINLNYNMAKSQTYLQTGGDVSDDFTARLPYVTADSSNPDAENGVTNCNKFVKLNGRKYAIIKRGWSGWMRSYDNNRIALTEPELMTDRIPIEIPVGFNSPQSIADLITLNLQMTNPLNFDGKSIEDLTGAVANYYKVDANQNPNPRVGQYALNGYTYKSINANWTITGTQEFVDQAHLIYGSMATDEPYKWLYGTEILSRAETVPLINHNWFNPNTFGSQTAIDRMELAYPCIIWNTLIGNSPDTPDLQNYSLYSPSQPRVISGDQFSDDIISVDEFTGDDFTIYNDVYRNVYTGDIGAYLIRQDNLYTIIKNDVVTVTDDQGLQVKTALFVDQTDPNFTNLIGWNKYNILGGTWNRTSEQLVRTDIKNREDFEDLLDFSPSDAGDVGDIGTLDPFQGDGFVANFPIAAGTFGDKYVFNWMSDNRIVEGEKYTLSFTTKAVAGTATPYIHPIIVADRASAFGMNAMNITTDGNHSQTFTATASYTGNNAIMIGYRKQLPAGLVVEVTAISFLRDDTETDETYNVRDLNSTGDATIDLTNFENNKLYSIQQNASIGTYNLTLSGNTIPSQGAYTGVDYNRNYQVLVRGLIATYNGSEFVASNLLNGHDPNVCILYNNDDANYTYFIFQGYSFTDRWTIYRLSKYNGGIPVSGDVLGSIESVGFNLKLGTRNGQQYFDFSQGNSFEYERDTPDYNAGNTWGNSLTSPLQYTASNHQPPLTLNYQIYLKDNTYSGGTASYTYSFQDTEGITVNGNEYDSIFTIDTNTGSIFTAYLLTNRVDGLSGIYEFNNSTAGNTWTISTTGGHNGFGYIHFAGAFGTLLSPTTAWVVNNIAFNYDWDFDATPSGYTQDYLLSLDPLNLKQGSYMYFGSSNSFIAYQSIGTFTYDDATRTISFYRRGSGTLHNTLITSVNPVPNLDYSANYTNQVTNPLPTLAVGNPINKTVSYFGQISTHVAYGPNKLTWYFTMNGADLEGKSGTIYWQDGADWNQSTWSWNSSNQITLNGVEGGGSDQILTLTGTTPSLTNVFDYPVSQNVSDAGSIFSVPTDGQMYGSGYGAFGSTTFSQSVASTLFLGAGLTNTDYRTTLDLHEGYCYDNQNDDWANNNGLKWNYAHGKLSITRVSDNVKLSEYSKQGGENSIIKWGWILTRTDKNVIFNTLSSFFNPISNLQLQTLSQTPSQIEHVTLITIQNGDYDAKDLNGNSVGGGTAGILNTPDAYLDKSIAKIPKSTLLMTNIKFTLDNIKRIQKFFRYNEVYNGTETNRKDIIADFENYYVEMDLNWTDNNTLSINSRNTADNTSANKGVVLPYYYHYGQMGVDDSNEGGSEINEGVIFPRKNSKGNEQRIRIFTRWQDDPYTRTIYTNRVDYAYTFCNSYRQERLESELSDLYQYIKNNNIGVIPMPMNSEDGFCCCFEVYQDYINEELYTQQSLQFFGWSPSEFDHNYVIAMNPDAPAIKNNDFNLTGREQDQMNFVNVGATNPTVSYNDSLNKFEISNFHTNLQFNAESGTAGQEQQPYYEVRKEDILFVDFMKDENSFDSGRIVDGIADSQSGIYINNVYFQYTKDKLITDINDPNVVEANPTNFYGSALWRMGFSYFQYKPLNFYEKSFNNRYNNLFYNSLRTDFRRYGVRPFTTNALVNIASAPALNNFTQNTGRQSTENPNKGTPIYGLGYNNSQSASVQAISDKLVAKSLTINMKSPFFRIVTPDLPLDTLIYTAQGQRLNSIGTAILNYSSANMFFYSYASSYQATISRDVTLNSINIQFVDDTGNLVQGLDDRSSVTIKVIRQIQLDDEEDPVVEELGDIESQLKDLNEKEEIENTNDKLERAGETEGLGIGIGTGIRESVGEQIETREESGDTRLALREPIRLAVREPIRVSGESPRPRREPLRLRETTEEEASRVRPISQEANRFIDSMILAIIQNGLNFTTITQRAKPRNYNDLSNIFSRGVIEYYLSNLPFINRMIDGLSREGMDFLRNNQDLTNFFEQNNNFYLTESGEMITDGKESSASYSINSEGAEVILDKINELFQNVDLRTNQKGEIQISPQQERQIANSLKPTIKNLLEAGGTIIPPRPVVREEEVSKGQRRGAGGLRPPKYNMQQRKLLSQLIGPKFSDFIENLGIDLNYRDDRSIPLEQRRSPLEKQLFKRKNLRLYNAVKQHLLKNDDASFRSAIGELLKRIRSAGVKRINNFNVLKYLTSSRYLTTRSGKPLFSAGRDTLVKNLKFLYEDEPVPPEFKNLSRTGGSERVGGKATASKEAEAEAEAEPITSPRAGPRADPNPTESKEEKED